MDLASNGFLVITLMLGLGCAMILSLIVVKFFRWLSSVWGQPPEKSNEPENKQPQSTASIRTFSFMVILCGVMVYTFCCYGAKIKAYNKLQNEMRELQQRYDTQQRYNSGNYVPRSQYESDIASQQQVINDLQSELSKYRSADTVPTVQTEQSVSDVLAMPPNMVSFTRYWKSEYDGYSYSVTYQINKNLYDFYRSKDRYGQSTPNDCESYIKEAQSCAAADAVIAEFNGLRTKYGWSEWQEMQEVITFVQTMPYMTDSDFIGRSEYLKYPIETLYDGTGDCEDFSFLLACLLKRMRIGVCIIDYPQHVMIGIRVNAKSGTYFTIDDEKYYVVETTSRRKIGELPEDYVGISAEHVIKIT